MKTYRVSEIWMGGGADDDGGMELLAAQDEPQEEDAGDQASAEDEEEPATVEGESEGEHEEDEEPTATEAGGSEGSNESGVLTVIRSFPSHSRIRPRGSSTSGMSIKLLWKTPCLPISITIVWEIASAPFLFR